jgi:SAM-dependent methyltransferase
MSDPSDIKGAGSDTAKPLALRKRINVIARHLQKGQTKFLDCGCGGGAYVFELIDGLGLDAYGIEIEEEKVRRAQMHSKHGRRITRGDTQNLAMDSASWDYVMLNEVLEHVPDDRAAIREAHRILRPGGIAFIFSPNRWYPFETHGVISRRSNRLLPHWIPFIPFLPVSVGEKYFKYWARNYGQAELRRLLVSAGFEIVEHSFVWQTLEGISGWNPVFLRPVKPILRTVFAIAERVPFIRRFGVSQVLVCRKLE